MLLYYLFYLSSCSLLVSMLWLRSATAVKWRKDEKLSISNMSSSQTFFKSFCKHFRQQFWFITNWYSAFYNLNTIKKALNYVKSLMSIHRINSFCFYLSMLFTCCLIRESIYLLSFLVNVKKHSKCSANCPRSATMFYWKASSCWEYDLDNKYELNFFVAEKQPWPIKEKNNISSYLKVVLNNSKLSCNSRVL